MVASSNKSHVRVHVRKNLVGLLDTIIQYEEKTKFLFDYNEFFKTDFFVSIV